MNAQHFVKGVLGLPAGKTSNGLASSRAPWRPLLALLLFGASGATQAQVPSNPFEYTRTSSFSYYQPSDGAKNGLLKSETIEPDNPQLCSTTSYEYDDFGNKRAATTQNCANASGLAAFATRVNTSTYAAQSVAVGGTTVGSVAGIFATSAANTLNQTESRQYDPRFGSVTQLTGPNQLTTTVQLDDFGRTIKELRADGTSTVTFYCYIAAFGLSTASNAPECANLPAAAAPSAAVMFVHSEPRGSNGAKIGAFVRTYSDKFGRQIRSVTEAFDGDAQASAYRGALILQDTIYNAAGAKVAQTQPYFEGKLSSTTTGANDLGISRTDYDALGRPVAVYVADPNGSQGNVTFASGYPAQRAAMQTIAYNGLDTLTTNDKGQTRKEEKNPNGQTVRVTDATGAQVAYQHDAFGNLLNTKDALQNKITVVYDIRGRKAQMNDPDTGVWQYQYDAIGQLVWQQNANQRAAGTVTTMAYDALGRMYNRVEPEFTSTWTFDKYANGSACNKGIGKLCESNTSNGVNKKVVYDGLGRAVNTRTTIANGPSFASATGYDDAVTGRVTSQTYPTGLKVGYAYTSGSVKGFLEKLVLLTPANVTPLPATPGGSPVGGANLGVNATLWQAQVVNAWGRAEQQAYGNGVITKAVLEAATGRTTDLQAGPNNTVLNQHYNWDSLNNLSARTDANGDGNTGAVSETFTYADGLNRLTTYQVSAPAIPNLSRTVNLTYNALGMVLSKSDVGDYTYGAQGANAVRPHALQSMAGNISGSYSYDANGNLTNAGGGKYRTIAYTSFNLPDSQSGIAGTSNGGSRYTWQYDESHARIKEVRTLNGGTFAGTRTTWNIHPDNQGGLGFESETNTPSNPNGQNVNATSNRHYLSVGGQAIGVMVTTGALPGLGTADMAPPNLNSITVVKLEYWHKDQLGSLITTTDHLGNVTQRYAYDPFGKRRYTNGSYDAAGNLTVSWSAGVNYGTERGFTGHQELDEVGLVHMNGRIFDPNLGIFLQGDPLIQDPLNLQNYNRYGYCYSNPLTCTDPSGYSGWTTFRDKWLKPIVAIVAAYFTAGASWEYFAFELQLGATTSVVGAAAVGGFTAGAINTGTFSGAFQGAVTGAAFAGVGEYLNGSGYFNDGSGVASPGEWSTQGVALHGVVGCFSSAAAGSKCGPGALSAAFSQAALPIKGSDPISGLISSAVVGGTASVIAGGKFSNGAQTAAFGYLFNCLPHECWKKYPELEPYKDIIQAGNIDWDANLEKASSLSAFGFYKAVRTGGEWDYKNNILFEDSNLLQEFGNFHFGAMAAQTGFSLTTSLWGAGTYQTFVQNRSLSAGFSNGWSFSSILLNDRAAAVYTSFGYRWGDNPGDSASILKGYLTRKKP